MAVHRVVAEVGLAADEPARKWRLRIVEHLPERALPVHEPRFFVPESVALGERAAVEIAIDEHAVTPSVAAMVTNGRWRP
jgi:hypothetical protein